VSDTGAGIPHAELEKIFEPFYRTQNARDSQARGVGLGLYLVRQQMESMGGSVTVMSQTGRGSCFVLHFPVSAERLREASAPSPSAEKEAFPAAGLRH